MRDLRDWGYCCSLNRVARLMLVAGLKARHKRRRLPTDTGARQECLIAPNLLDREFEATAPNQRWVADFTYKTEQGITCSMSRSGDVWDNSAMESFFGSLKKERVNRKQYFTRAQARADVFDYVERFYNPYRRHSTIGYVSPVQFERLAEEA